MPPLRSSIRLLKRSYTGRAQKRRDPAAEMTSRSPSGPGNVRGFRFLPPCSLGVARPGAAEPAVQRGLAHAGLRDDLRDGVPPALVHTDGAGDVGLAQLRLPAGMPAPPGGRDGCDRREMLEERRMGGLGRVDVFLHEDELVARIVHRQRDGDRLVGAFPERGQRARHDHVAGVAAFEQDPDAAFRDAGRPGRPHPPRLRRDRLVEALIGRHELFEPLEALPRGREPLLAIGEQHPAVALQAPVRIEVDRPRGEPLVGELPFRHQTGKLGRDPPHPALQLVPPPGDRVLFPEAGQDLLEVGPQRYLEADRVHDRHAHDPLGDAHVVAAAAPVVLAAFVDAAARLARLRVEPPVEDHRLPALGAEEHPLEQVGHLLPFRGERLGPLPHVDLPALPHGVRRLPCLLRHEGGMRPGEREALLLARPAPRDALEQGLVRFAHDEQPRVHGIVQELADVDSRPRHVSERGGSPFSALGRAVLHGRRRAHLLQRVGDVRKALSLEVHVEDERHERRGLPVDHQPVRLVVDAVAVPGAAERRLALGHLAPLGRTDLAAGLQRVHLVHQVPEGDGDAPVAAQGVQPVVDGDEPHPHEGEDALEVRAGLVHVATEAAEVLAGDAVDPARPHLVHEVLELAPPLEGGSRPSVVGVHPDDLDVLVQAERVFHVGDLGPHAPVVRESVVLAAQARVHRAPPGPSFGRVLPGLGSCRPLPRLPSHGRASFPQLRSGRRGSCGAAPRWRR